MEDEDNWKNHHPAIMLKWNEGTGRCIMGNDPPGDGNGGKKATLGIIYSEGTGTHKGWK